MRVKDCVKQTEDFLRKSFLESTVEDTNRDYRVEHSFRVANIGAKIAREEGFDVEMMVIACLLHDISYSGTFTDNDYGNHGRDSARIARPFLKGLGFEDNEIQEMCYGIAIHVDEKADFDGEKTPFALSVGDADNIDRFDAYRLFETLRYKEYDKMCLEDKKAFVEKVLNRLEELKTIEIGTETARKMWYEKLDYQSSFYRKLKSQNDNSTHTLI